MKIQKTILSIAVLLALTGCGTSGIAQSEYDSVVAERDKYKTLYEDTLKQLNEIENQREVANANVENEEPKPELEIDPKDYDYKTDPNTIAVNVTAENLSEYVSPVVIEKKDGTFSIAMHSLMYDKGYVVMGCYYCDWTWDAYYMADGNVYHCPFGSNYLFGNDLGYKFETREQAQEYADKGIEAFNPVFRYDDSLVYYQKLEDVKYGYEMKDGKRILNGQESRSDGYFEENPF